MKCKVDTHSKENADLICLQQTCLNQDQFCKICLNQLHSDHKEQCVGLDELNEFLEIKSLEPLKTQFYQKINQQKDYLSKCFNLLKQQDYKLLQRNQILAIFQLFDTQSKFLLIQFDSCLRQIQEMYDQITTTVNTINQAIQQKQQQNLHKSKIIQSQKEDKINNEIDISTPKQQQKSSIQENINNNQIIQQEQNEYIQNENKSINQQKIKKQTQEEKEARYLQTLYDKLDELKMTNKRFTNKQNQQEDFSGEYQKNRVRIQNFVQGPITFFPSPNAENVFAGNGKFVQYCDITEGQLIQEDFRLLMILFVNFCPEKIKQLFINQEINEQSYYLIQIFHLVSRKIVYYQLDDHIDQDKKQLIGHNNSIWINLLWRTISQVVNINNSSYLLFSIALFPAPIIFFDTIDDHLLDLLEEEVKENAFILAHEKPMEKDQNSLNQVLGFCSVQNPLLGEDTMLVKLRNPFSKHLYNGDWGFQSPYWTEDMIKQLNVPVDDDGIFYMDFINFLNDFRYFTSQRIHAKLAFKENCILKQKQGNYFQLIIEKPIEYLFQLYFKNLKTIGEPIQQILIGKVIQENQNNSHIINENSKFEYFDSNTHKFPLSFKVNFTPGTYVVYLRVRSKQYEQLINGSLRVFGEQPAKFEQISKINSFKNQIAMSLIQLESQNITKNQFYKLITTKSEITSNLYIQNISNQAIKVRVDLETSNCKLSKPFSGEFVEKRLKQSESMLIIIKRLEEYATYKKTITVNDQYKFH